MNIDNKQCILIFFIILLIIFHNNDNIAIITAFGISYLLFNMFLKNKLLATGLSFLVLISLYLFKAHNKSKYYENFETEEIMKQLDELSEKVTTNNMVNSNSNTDTNKNSTDSSNVDENEDTNADKEIDISEIDFDKDNSGNIDQNDVEKKYMTASDAQKETFRLINTIKQLDDTVKNLTPTLKQGADIIDRFKKLGFH